MATLFGVISDEYKTTRKKQIFKEMSYTVKKVLLNFKKLITSPKIAIGGINLEEGISPDSEQAIYTTDISHVIKVGDIN